MERTIPVKRRSWMLAPAARMQPIEEAARSKPDVIVLDLVELIADRDKAAARGGFRAAIETAQHSQADVFAQIDARSLDADLQACVWPGLSGVVVSRAESAEQIERTAALIAHLESERGLAPRELQIVAAVETAPGNHAAYDIAGASPRVWGITLGRADLVMDLRPEPSNEIHLMPYLMQRLIIIAGARGIIPIGAWWRAPDRGLLATPERTYEAARRGRAIGFKGGLCLRADQVEPLNRGYS